MGHDISGYKITDKENEIAYLGRNAYDGLNVEIYNSLNCLHCSGGVSGNGSEMDFTKEELLKALEYLGDNENLEPERKFVKDCLENIDEDSKILVRFY
jgi:hypothetical protein